MAGFEADLGEGLAPAERELKISLSGDFPRVAEIPITLLLDADVTGLQPGRGFHVMVIQPQASAFEAYLAPLILTEELKFPEASGQELTVRIPANAFLQDKSLTEGRLEATVILLKAGLPSPAQ